MDKRRLYVGKEQNANLADISWTIGRWDIRKLIEALSSKPNVYVDSDYESEIVVEVKHYVAEMESSHHFHHLSVSPFIINVWRMYASSQRPISRKHFKWWPKTTLCQHQDTSCTYFLSISLSLCNACKVRKCIYSHEKCEVLLHTEQHFWVKMAELCAETTENRESTQHT